MMSISARASRRVAARAASTTTTAATTTRLALDRFIHDPTATNGDAIKQEQGNSDSELSAPPSSPDNTGSSRKPSTAPNGSLKRKRATAGGGTNTPATSITTTGSEVTATARRSPRKAPKLDPDRPPRRPKKQPAKTTTHADGTTTTTAPANWEALYDATTAFRAKITAPVDTVGCENLAEPDRAPVVRRLQTLIALMLSSQTKDAVTAAAMRALQTGLPAATGGLTLASLLAVSESGLNALICKVGFHNTKAKHIKQTAEILRDRFGGDIPDTAEGLISLPGVGPKMAYLTLSAAWGRDEGIGVDVHVHRITNLWGWHATRTPEQTRAALEAWLPRNKWHDINRLLVGLGQTVCLPVGRRCGECELSQKGLCPAAVAGSPAKRRVKAEVKVEIKAEEEEDERAAQVMAVQTDDVATTVQIKTEDLGELEMEAPAGEVPDIEGLGAGRARKLEQMVNGRSGRTRTR